MTLISVALLEFEYSDFLTPAKLNLVAPNFFFFILSKKRQNE